MDRRTLLTVLGLSGLGLTGLNLAGCTPEPDPGRQLALHLAPHPTPRPTPATFPFPDFADALNTRLFSSSNAAWSPFSVSWALALTASGAKAATASEFKKLLGSVDSASREALADIIGRLASSGLVQLGGATIVQEGFGLKDAFAATSDALASPVGRADIVGQPDATVAAVNAWVAKITNRRITDLVHRDAIDALTRMILVNALALKGAWDATFKEVGRLRFATAPDQYVEVPYASGASRVVYDRTTQWEGVAVPLAHPDFLCVMAMLNSSAPSPKPSPRTPTPAVPTSTPVAGASGLASIRTAELITLACDPGESSTELEFPLWTGRVRYELKPVLQALGVASAFEPNRADLTGIADGPRPSDRLHLQSVAHEAFVAITAEGVEAAGGSHVGFGAGAAPAPKRFRIDRPYAFCIVHKPTRTPLFCGQVLDPSR